MKEQLELHIDHIRNGRTAEDILYEILLKSGFPLSPRRQHPRGCYVVDFVCVEAKLVVEVGGGQHSERQGYDASRTEWLRHKGFRVVRFWNHEVMNDIEAVKTAIGEALHEDSQPPSQPSPLQREGAK